MTLTFTRLLSTGDPLDYALVNDDVYMLWAYCATPGIDPTDYQIHDNFGSVYLNLFNTSQDAAPTTPAPSVTPAPISNNSYTSPNQDFTMQWTISPDQQYVYITMAAAAGSGYVSVGFNPNNGLMAGSDMYVGWVDASSGTAVAFDMYSSGDVQPSLDTALGGESNLDQISGTSVRVPGPRWAAWLHA